jgi:hypothetical protein
MALLLMTGYRLGFREGGCLMVIYAYCHHFYNYTYEAY